MRNLLMVCFGKIRAAWARMEGGGEAKRHENNTQRVQKALPNARTSFWVTINLSMTCL